MHKISFTMKNITNARTGFCCLSLIFFNITLWIPNWLKQYEVYNKKMMNVIGEVWMWVHQKYGMSQIVQFFLLNQNKQLMLPFCSRRCSIISTKQWMWVMKYEYECIKNMEWVESYGNYIQLKQTTAITSLLLTMVDWINKTMNASDELWRWVHQNYGMSWILNKLYSIETEKYLTSLLPTMVSWIDKTMNDSDEVWIFVHQNHGTSQIIWTLY